MVVAVSGNIHHETVEQAVSHHFGDVAAGRAFTFSDSLPQTGASHVQKDHLEQTQSMVAYPAIAINDPRTIPLQLFSTLMGGGLSSRLFQEVREQKGLAYTVQSFLTSYRDAGLWGVYAATSPEQIGALRDCLQQEIAKFMEKGIEPGELERAQQQQISALMMRRESVAGIAEWIARHIQDYGEYRPAHKLADKIRETQAAEIEKVAGDILTAEPPLLATLGPKG
jgi:predicted Zn-dependent peptidase